jgi:hypothetical protein
MLFIAVSHDKPGHLSVRMATREAHLAWMKGLGATIRIAGPFLDEAGADPQGSVVVVEAADLAAAKALFAEDPYVKAGLFERVEIRPWRWVIGAPA